MRAYEFIIMPQTVKPMGLVHKPGIGPNNRFDFKNKNNNKANEKAPPGREHQVKALKKKFGKSGAYAQASLRASVAAAAAATVLQLQEAHR